MKCAVLNCPTDYKVKAAECSLFSFPVNPVLRKKWIQFCRQNADYNFKQAYICMEHFVREDVANMLQFEMGYCKKRILRRNAVPTIYNKTPQQQNYKKIVDELLREHEETLTSTTSVEIAKCDINEASNNTIISNDEHWEKIIMINEALFDYDESNAQADIVISDDDSEFSPFSPLVDTKTEDIDDVSQFSHSKGTQTEDEATDRINCGFVKVSKSGPNKLFNLRCFYCDAEYPIKLWAEFSDHIVYNHGHKEEAYEKKDDLKPSTRNEHNICVKMHLMDSAKLPSSDFVNSDNICENVTAGLAEVNNSKQEHSELFDILSESSDSSNHSYSQYDFNESTSEAIFDDAALIDEICFAKTPHKIVLDFLEHLKGFPSLWHDRKIDSAKYDKELLELINILTFKWSLNLQINYLRKDLENIKAWFCIIKAEEKTDINGTHGQEMFDEYYRKCSEFLNIGIDIKHNIPCDLCDCTFANVLLLQTHKHRRHKIGQRPYKCSRCVRRFAHIRSLLGHVERHSRMLPSKKRKQIIDKEPTNLVCFECNETFSCANEYRNHLDIHPKGNCPYACEECGNRYKSSYHRNIHQRRHKLTEFQCELCPAKLSCSKSLSVHMLAHNGIYEYICEHCGQSFVCQKYLTEHRQFAHLGYGVCKICNREYKKRTILRKHLRDRHRPTFGTNEELSKPRRSYKIKEGKGENLKLRKYEYITDPVTQKTRVKCPRCDKSFRRNQNLRLHATKAHNFDMRTILRYGERLKRLKLLKNSNINIDIVNKNAALDVSTITKTKFEITELETIDKLQETHANDNFFTTSNSLHLHSSSDLLGVNGQSSDAPLVTKDEDFECGSYELI